MISQIENTREYINSSTVRREMDRRQFEAEEAERMRIEREERRAAKLAFKLKRREDRRLFNLTNKIMEVFVAVGQESNEDMALSDVDGNMDVDRKYVGLLGGLLGEICLVLDSVCDPNFVKHIPNLELVRLLIVDCIRTWAN